MRDSKVQIIPFDGDQRYLRLLGGIPQTRGMRSGYVVLQPGESVGEHSTQDKEEAVIVLEGSVQVVADGQAAGVAHGDAQVRALRAR
ncbi:MAG TPA: cupin domain-containing protein, partial [Candidatus Omnitrophota bacterium]|nr:cupin domain-containing protein [Candidatus Omnitrophota bacterium]